MMLVPLSITLCLITLPAVSANAVDERPPSFGERVKNVTATRGRDATLVCVTENLQGYKVAWIKVNTQTILTIGSHLITRDYQISLSQSDGRVWNLRIRNVDRSDTGWYMCQINTDPMLSQMGYLEVVEPPDIGLDESSKDMLVQEGDNTRLRCVARGYPEPTIKWFREGGNSQPLLSSPGVTINGTDIQFSPVRRHHMAVYLCVASNGVPPSVSKRIVLHVQFKPLVNASTSLMSAAQGTPVTLQCNTEAYPRSVVYWVSANSGVVSSGVRHQVEDIVDGYKLTMRLKILKVDGSDFTTYKCVAKNSFGEAEGTIRLTERDPTPEERRLLRADAEEAEAARRRQQQHQRQRQQEEEAARAAQRLREQRLQEERRRQRDRQRSSQRPRGHTAADESQQHRPSADAGITADRPTERPTQGSSGAAVRRPGLGLAPAGLPLPPLLPLLLLLSAAAGPLWL